MLELDLTPRLTTAHHRVDALRGAVAVERGPIVYCVEHADLDGALDVDDMAVVPAPITVRERGTLACGAGRRAPRTALLLDAPA